MKEIFANIIFYKTEDGGRKSDLPNMRYNCPLFFEDVEALSSNGYDCRLLLNQLNEPINLGDTINDVQVLFLSEQEILPHIKIGTKFKIWESGYIGEGVISKLDRDATDTILLESIAEEVRKVNGNLDASAIKQRVSSAINSRQEFSDKERAEIIIRLNQLFS